MTALSCDSPVDAFARFADVAAMGEVWRERLPTLLDTPFEFAACNVQYARCRTYLNPISWHKSFLCVCYEFDAIPGHIASHKPMLYGRVYLEGRSRIEFDSLQQRGGARLVPELDMIVWTFPDDPCLPQLRELLDVSQVVRHLPYADLPFPDAKSIVAIAVCVVRYRPEQRCILRYDIQYGAIGEPYVLYAKVFADDNGEHVFSRIQRCYAAANALGVRIARPVAYSAAVRSVWQEELAGKPLTEIRDRDYRAPMDAVGHCLAKLHASDLPMHKAVTREARLADAAKKSRKLAQMLPALDAELSGLIAREYAELQQLPPAPQAVIHGDVHFGQFLMTAEGELALFDFDEWSSGDPAQDLADLIVDPHVSQFARDQAKTNQILSSRIAAVMLASYRKHAAWAVSDATIAWHARIQLINKAYRAAIQQEPRWQEKVPALIALAIGGIDLGANLEQELSK